MVAVLLGLGREVSPIAAGLGLADAAADNLFAETDRVPKKFFLGALAGRSLDHAAEPEQMHVDCDRGRAASLRELLLA